jgi:imidazolonepropionase-like amidohydrolase
MSRAGELQEDFVLRGLSVLDESGGFSGPLDVWVSEGRVVELGDGIAAGGAASIDVSGLWLMPGVFDCHDHVSMSSLNLGETLATPVSLWALESAQNARRTLEAGVTFVRDMAGADAGMREAIARGYVPGPTLQVSTVLISQTGGHGDGYLAGAGLELTPGYLTPNYPGKPRFVLDGTDAMRQVVREVIRSGADWIKLATTGGLVSDHDHPLVADFTLEEVETAVSEARRKGKPVAAHAYGGEGLDNAVAAGVRSIEHGGFLTEQQAKRMADAGCFLVPTLSAMRDTLVWAERGSLTPVQCRKILGFGLELGAAVRVAKAYGVPLALGTDYISRDQHGNNLEELQLMHEAGLTLEETLLVATAAGAELCGVGDRYGRIAPGYVFDALLLEREPSDLRELRAPGALGAVFKAGRAVLGGPRIREQGLAGSGSIS